MDGRLPHSPSGTRGVRTANHPSVVGHGGEDYSTVSKRVNFYF